MRTPQHSAQGVVATNSVRPVEFVMEMHDYQEEYLSKKAVDHNLDSGGAFRALLTHAATDPSNWGDIFRTVHCLRCDNLPDNLSTADNAWKKSKKPVRFGLQPDHTAFLEARVANEEGVDIAEKGPVNRAVLDTGKAARTLIDWAIEQEEVGVELVDVFENPVRYSIPNSQCSSRRHRCCLVLPRAAAAAAAAAAVATAVVVAAVALLRMETM